jgi:putative restriction endonuclease
MVGRNNWSREEHLIAFNLYCQIPFGRIHKTNPRVIALSEILGRTPSSVVF